MESALPERNHAVKFVAVNDDGTDSHAFKAKLRDLQHNLPIILSVLQ